jgi:hypothetical protein
MGIVSLFVTVSVILSFLANISCSAVSFYSPMSGGINLQFGVYLRKSADVWGYDGDEFKIYKTCINYDGDNMNPDAKWNTAKAFTIFAIVFGSLLPCVSCAMPNLYKPIGACMLLVCLFQGLTLLLLDSNLCKNNNVINTINNEIPNENADRRFTTECSRDWGYNSNIACVVFWFLTAVLMIALPTSDNAGGTEEVAPQDEEASPEESELKEMDAEEPIQEEADVVDSSMEKGDP